MAKRGTNVVDTKIQEELNEQVELALTMYSLIDQGLLKTLIKPYKYDISLRRIDLGKLPKDVLEKDVFAHFENKHLYTAGSFYYNMLYDFTELGIINNEETNIDKAVKPIIDIINEINEEIDLDVINHRNEEKRWREFKTAVLNEYDEAQCLKKLRIKKLKKTIKIVNSEIAYLNKKIEKFTKGTKRRLHKQVGAFFLEQFNIDLHQRNIQKNPLCNYITDLDIVLKKESEKEVYEFLVMFLELFVKYYSLVLNNAILQSKRDAYEIFDLDYTAIKDEFYNSIIPSKDKIIPNPDGYILNKDYVKYFSFDFGLIMSCLQECTGRVIRDYITKEIKRRKRIDAAVQVIPNIFSYLTFAFSAFVLIKYNFELLKEMVGRLELLIVYALLFVSLVFCIVNLIRNTKQFKRPKRAKYQKVSLMIILIFGFISGSSEAFFVNRYDGYDEHFYYSFNGNQSVMVDDLRDKDIVNAVIPDVVDSLVCPKITTDYKVTEINKKTFYNCDSLVTVRISDNVVDLGSKAFMNCHNLVEVRLPQGISEIKNKTFYKCDNLKLLSGDYQLEVAGDQAFYGCASLENIDFSYFKEIGKKSFDGCITFTKIVLGEEINSIDDYAFANCTSVQELSSITSPNHLGKNAFDNIYSLETVYLSTDKYLLTDYLSDDEINNIRYANIVNGSSIPDYYFKNAHNLLNVNLSSNITSIGVEAFAGCSLLKGIDLPNSITEIKQYAFKESGLVEITIPDNITVINEGLFEACTQLQLVNYSENTTRIEKNAFYNCVNLSNISLYEGLEYIGDSAFYGCIVISTFDFPTTLTHVGNKAFSLCRSTFNTFSNLVSIGEEAFYSCENIVNLDLGSNLNYIGKNAFANCANITNVNIDYSNLSDVTPLGNIINPNSIVTINVKSLDDIPEYYLQNLSSLTEVNFIDCEMQEIKKGVFKGCSSLRSIDLSNSNYTKIADEAFSGCSSLSNVVLGPNLKEIGVDAFRNCSELTEIALPDSLKIISQGAFFGCGFINLEIPGCVEVIGKEAFLGCGKLTSLVIDFSSIIEYNSLSQMFSGNSLNSIVCIRMKDMPEAFLKDYFSLQSVDFVDCTFDYISKEAFANCSELDEIDLRETTIKTINESAFEYCTNLNIVYFNEGLETISTKAFYECTNLLYFTFPQTLKVIGDQAFIGVPIRELYISDSVESIGINAFFRCPNLTSINIDYSNFKEITTIKDIVELTNLKTAHLVNLNSMPDNYFAEARSLESISLNNCNINTISKNAFYNCNSLKSINLTDLDIITIESGAFKGCTNLSSIVFNDELSEIKNDAFSDCSSLKSINFPNSLKHIGENAFRNCSMITNICIESNIESIGEGAFIGCDEISSISLDYQNISNIDPLTDILSFANLENVTICNLTTMPKKYMAGFNCVERIEFIGCTFETIPEKAFYECVSLVSMNLYTVPVRIIEEEAFYNCHNILELSFNNTLLEIHQNAFSGCSSVQTLNLPNLLKVIEKEAFFGLRCLETLTLPSSLEEVGRNAFGELNSIEYIKMPIIEKKFKNIFGQSSVQTIEVYDSEEIEVLYFSGLQTLRNVILSDSVKKINSQAFYFSTKLKNINLENIEEIDDGAFGLCYELTDITFSDNLKFIGEKAFEDCHGLISLGLPNSLTEIGKGAFENCTNIASLNIPTSVTKIGKDAFADCESLQEVTFKILTKTGFFGSTLKFIDIFNGNYKLKTVNIIDTEVIPNNYFKNCDFVKIVNLSEDVKELGKKSFYNLSNLVSIDLSKTGIEVIPNDTFYNCYSLIDVKLPSALTSIGKNAFRNCYQLTSTNLGSTATTSIGDFAFYNCESLQSINLPTTLEKIGVSSFGRCISLKEINLSNTTIKTLPKMCFEDCYELTTVLFNSQIETIEEQSFAYCNALVYIDMSETAISEIGKKAFFSCIQVESIILPTSLEKISDHCFSGCTNLSNINLRDTSVSVIPKYAFSGCGNMGNILYEGITKIESNAFYKAAPIFELSIPSTVKKIGSNALSYESIHNLCIDTNNEKIWDTKIKKYFNCSINYVYVIDGKEIYNNMFKSLDADSIELHDGIERIGKYAFARTMIKEFSLPTSLTYVGTGAFNYCYELNKVNISSIEDFLKIEFRSSGSNPLKYAHNLYMNDAHLSQMHINTEQTIKKYQFCGLHIENLVIYQCEFIERNAFKDVDIYNVEINSTPEELETFCKDKYLLEREIFFFEE